MKSNARFQLEEKWWDREAPKDLGRAAKALSEALRKFSMADGALNLQASDDQLSSAELDELAKCVKLLDEVAIAGADALKEIEPLVRKEDKGDRRTDLENTAEALKKALPKAIAEKRAEYEALDGDAGTAPLVSPAAHAAYLKRAIPRLKRMEHNFGFALVSNEPDAQRLLFSKRKGARSLATNIRNDTKPRLITWGTAAGGSALPGGEYSGMTLVLTLEGRKVPNLARRIRLLLRALGLSGFNKVVIRQDGREEDASDETETETAVAEVEAVEDDGLDGVAAEEAAAVEEAAVAATEKAAAEEKAAAKLQRPDRKPNLEKQRWLELRNALASKVERAISLKHPGHPKLKTVWLMALEAATAKDYAKAIKCAQMLQPILAKYNPPPEPAFDKWMRVRDKLYPAMLKLIKAGKGDPWGYRGAWGASEMYHNDNNHTAALGALNELARLIAEGETAPNPRDMVPKTPTEEKEFAGRLLVKLEIMMGAAADLEEVYAADDKAGRDYRKRCGSCRDAIEAALAEPTAAAEGKPAKGRDFDAAFSQFGTLAQLIRNAEKFGKRTNRGLKELRKRLDALDTEVIEYAHLAVEPEFTELFRAINEARASILEFLRYEDVYGALAGIQDYAAAILEIETATGTLATA